MGKWHGWVALAALGVTVTGCASNKELATMKAENATLRDQLAASQHESEQTRLQLGALLSSSSEKEAELTKLSSWNADLKSQLDAINAQYAEAMANAEKFGAHIPPALANELTRLADTNSDVLEFDSKRGTLKFKSDVSFALGSADLTPKAKEVVATLAKILSSPAAKDFELMVAGHTDAMPVSRHSTIAAGHKNNWYLSAHRAISVGTELQGKSISPRRLAMVGYAEQRPIASNDNEAGRAKNRRVEILLLPTKVTDQSPIVWNKSKPKSSTPTKSSGTSTASTSDTK
ncbi:MAG TPA: OmpA family protein [Tepidisphaeraceae bacterium]|nr:OmpA family protein [Tepidisphaeraceae bacterium]